MTVAMFKGVEVTYPGELKSRQELEFPRLSDMDPS